MKKILLFLLCSLVALTILSAPVHAAKKKITKTVIVEEEIDEKDEAPVPLESKWGL